VGQCSAEPWAMNINRGITNITITTKRRDVLYKRTQSDESNENCIPATYGVPISRCCGPVPIKITASKTAQKVIRPTLCDQELMSCCSHWVSLSERLHLGGYLKRNLSGFVLRLLFQASLTVNSDTVLLTLRPAGNLAVINGYIRGCTSVSSLSLTASSILIWLHKCQLIVTLCLFCFDVVVKR
jgi:hypothetical protein